MNLRRAYLYTLATPYIRAQPHAALYIGAHSPHMCNITHTYTDHTSTPSYPDVHSVQTCNTTRTCTLTETSTTHMCAQRNINHIQAIQARSTSKRLRELEAGCGAHTRNIIHIHVQHHTHIRATSYTVHAHATTSCKHARPPQHRTFSHPRATAYIRAQRPPTRNIITTCTAYPHMHTHRASAGVNSRPAVVPHAQHHTQSTHTHHQPQFTHSNINHPYAHPPSERRRELEADSGGTVQPRAATASSSAPGRTPPAHLAAHVCRVHLDSSSSTSSSSG